MQRLDAAPVSRGRINIGIAVAALVLAGLFLLGTLPRLRNGSKLEAAAKDARQSVPTVALVKPTAATAGELTLPGDIEAIEQTAVNSRTVGYLRRRYVDIGSHVKAGQVLAEVESPDVDQQASQATAQTAQSRATVGQSQADVARLQAAVSQSQAGAAQQMATVQQARAQEAGAVSKLAQARSAQAQAEAARSGALQAVEQQKANLAQSEAQRDLAIATNRRYEDLAKQGYVAQQDVEQTQATVKTTAANVKAMQAAVSSSQAQVDAATQAVNAAKSAVEAARSDVSAAHENVKAAQSALRSLQSAVKAAQASVRSGEATVQANQAAVVSNQANQQRYAVLRGFERLVAPFDGVITARNVDTGALINPMTTAPTESGATPSIGLFGIARTDTVRIFVRVPQSFVNAVHTGQTAGVAVREFPGRTFPGAVYQVSGALDSASRTLLAEIHIRNADGSLRPGMFAQVKLQSSSARTAVRVPSNTLMIDSKGTRVATVVGGKKVHFVPIKIARDFGAEVEVAEGLTGDEELIVDPSDDLTEGATVNVASGH